MRRTLAIGVLAIGILVLLRAVGLLPASIWSYIDVYWPGLIVLWGLEEFFEKLLRGRRRVLWPAIVTFIGVLLLLNNLHFPWLAHFDPWMLILAILLIYFGLSSLFGYSYVRMRLRMGKEKWKKKAFKMHLDWDDPTAYTRDYGQWAPRMHKGDLLKVGEVRLGDEPWHLEPLLLNRGAGSIRINLGTATIPDGETPIEINNAAGEVRISVPEDLAVDVAVRVFAGEVRLFERRVDGMSLDGLTYVTPGYETAPKRVKIRVNVKLGEVRIIRVI